jgi:hypothetical protein
MSLIHYALRKQKKEGGQRKRGRKIKKILTIALWEKKNLLVILMKILYISTKMPRQKILKIFFNLGVKYPTFRISRNRRERLLPPTAEAGTWTSVT